MDAPSWDYITTEGKITVYFGAPAYQDKPEGRALKAELEKEFGVPSQEGDVGIGASTPGIEFLIDIADLVLRFGAIGWGALVLGKEIGELLEFYVEVTKRIGKFVTGHYAYVDPPGAYASAVTALVQHLGGVTKSIVLDGYMHGDMSGSLDPATELSIIDEMPCPGAYVAHHFQFKIDGKKRIKVIVDFDDVKVIELPQVKKPRKTGRAGVGARRC